MTTEIETSGKFENAEGSCSLGDDYQRLSKELAALEKTRDLLKQYEVEFGKVQKRAAKIKKNAAKHSTKDVAAAIYSDQLHDIANELTPNLIKTTALPVRYVGGVNCTLRGLEKEIAKMRTDMRTLLVEPNPIRYYGKSRKPAEVHQQREFVVPGPIAARSHYLETYTGICNTLKPGATRVFDTPARKCRTEESRSADGKTVTIRYVTKASNTATEEALTPRELTRKADENMALIYSPEDKARTTPLVVSWDLVKRNNLKAVQGEWLVRTIEAKLNPPKHYTLPKSEAFPEGGEIYGDTEIETTLTPVEATASNIEQALNKEQRDDIAQLTEPTMEDATVPSGDQPIILTVDMWMDVMRDTVKLYPAERMFRVGPKMYAFAPPGAKDMIDHKITFASKQPLRFPPLDEAAIRTLTQCVEEQGQGRLKELCLRPVAEKMAYIQHQHPDKNKFEAMLATTLPMLVANIDYLVDRDVLETIQKTTDAEQARLSKVISVRRSR
jgi:hypothetical protein